MTPGSRPLLHLNGVAAGAFEPGKPRLTISGRMTTGGHFLSVDETAASTRVLGRDMKSWQPACSLHDERSPASGEEEMLGTILIVLA